MKKKTAMALAAAMLSVILAACGGSNSEELEDVDAKTSENTQEEVQEESPQGVTIEEQTIYDQDGLTITATGLECDEEYGMAQLKLLIENEKTEDIRLYEDVTIVNDYCLIGGFDLTVPSGKKADGEIYLNQRSLENIGIGMSEIGQIEMNFILYSDDAAPTETGLVAVRTSAYDSMEIKDQDAGTEIYNANGIRMVYTGEMETTDSNVCAKIFIENTSGQDVICWITGGMVNDSVDLTTYNTPVVYAGKKAMGAIEYFVSDMKENGIESIDKIAVDVHITDLVQQSIGDYETITFSTK